MENEIQQIAEILGDSTSHVIGEYTKWYFISAIAWSTFWLAATIVAIKSKLEWVDDELRCPARAILAFMFAMGFAACVTNIFAPEAYAIHGLLIHIRG